MGHSLFVCNTNKLTKDDNEAFKQNLGDVDHGNVDSLFCLGICRDSVSAKLWFCRTAISHRHRSDVDDATIQKHLIEKCRRSNSDCSTIKG